MSGGGSQTSNTVSEFKPPDYTTGPGGWPDYVQNAINLTGQGLPIYTGQTVAPLSQQSQVGTGMLTSLATQGSPVYDQAETNLTGTLRGDFANPYATTANPYAGNNPYLDQMAQNVTSRMANAYGSGTAAQMAAAQARAGAFGGSAAQEADTNANRAFGDSLGQTLSNMYGQNYYNSANLAESGLNRATQAVNDERNRQMQAAQMAPGYQNADIQAIQAMMGGGDSIQNYQQNLLNAGANLFGQFQQAPWTLQDLLGNVLSRASGQGGSSSSQIIGPSMSPWQIGAGLGSLGYGLFGGK